MNRSVSLVRYAKLDCGWRRGAVVKSANGKIKHPVMLTKGIEVDAPQGRYQLLSYSGDRAIYTDLGNDPTEALSLFKAAQGKAKKHTSAVKAAEAAGLHISKPGLAPTAKREGKTLKQCVADFLTMHENLPHRADDSLSVYTGIASGFLALTTAVYPKDITQDDVIRWHGWMRNTKKYSDRTASNRYKSFRGFLKYCGLPPSSIIDAGTHKMLKQYTKKAVNTYTPEVIAKLIEYSMDANRGLLWDFFYKTGLRDSEVQALTRYDLHGLDTAEPTLHVKERDEYGRIKDAEERVIELHPSLVEPIKAWLRDNPTRVLLFGTANDRPDTKMLLGLKITARRAGLNCGHCRGCLGKSNECREFTLHRFRRTYTTRMLRATGGDLRSVMARTGHSDLTSVMRYLEPSAQIRAAVASAF